MSDEDDSDSADSGPGPIPNATDLVVLASRTSTLPLLTIPQDQVGWDTGSNSDSVMGDDRPGPWEWTDVGKCKPFRNRRTSSRSSRRGSEGRADRTPGQSSNREPSPLEASRDTRWHLSDVYKRLDDLATSARAADWPRRRLEDHASDSLGRPGRAACRAGPGPELLARTSATRLAALGHDDLPLPPSRLRARDLGLRTSVSMLGPLGRGATGQAGGQGAMGLLLSEERARKLRRMDHTYVSQESALERPRAHLNPLSSSSVTQLADLSDLSDLQDDALQLMSSRRAARDRLMRQWLDQSSIPASSRQVSQSSSLQEMPRLVEAPPSGLSDSALHPSQSQEPSASTSAGRLPTLPALPDIVLNRKPSAAAAAAGRVEEGPNPGGAELGEKRPEQIPPGPGSQSGDVAVKAEDQKSKDQGQLGQVGQDCADVQEAVLAVLECPVCRDFLQPPLKQCCNGHVVCFSCWPRLSLCPACRAPFIPTASLVLDGVLRALRFPCPNRDHGCGLYLKMDERAEHDQACPYRPRGCPLSRCDWQGLPGSLAAHCRSAHAPLELSPGEPRAVLFHVDRGAAALDGVPTIVYHEQRLLAQQQQLFLFQSRYDLWRSKFFAELVRVATVSQQRPHQPDCRYTWEVELVSPDSMVQLRMRNLVAVGAVNPADHQGGTGCSGAQAGTGTGGTPLPSSVGSATPGVKLDLDVFNQFMDCGRYTLRIGVDPFKHDS